MLIVAIVIGVVVLFGNKFAMAVSGLVPTGSGGAVPQVTNATPIAPPTTDGAFRLDQQKPTPNGIPFVGATNQNTLLSNPANAPAPWAKNACSITTTPAQSPVSPTFSLNPIAVPSKVLGVSSVRRATRINAYLPSRMG